MGDSLKDGRPSYIDLCHPRKGEPHTAIVLWIHDGTGIESKSAKGGKEHDSFWDGNFPGSGRVDAAKKVGTVGITDADRRAARRIAEDAVAEFPGVRFWVFHESDWGVTMQEFWEATS